eukprot:6080915-Amphidinium_carterae.1
MIEVDVDAEVDAVVADSLGDVLDDVNDGTAELELVDVNVIVDVDVLKEVLSDVGVVCNCKERNGDKEVVDVKVVAIAAAA